MQQNSKLSPSHSSYVEDPKWQRRFTEIWVGCLGLAIVLSLPSIYRAFRARRAFIGPFGVWEGRSYAPVPTTPQKEVTLRSKNNNALGCLSVSLSVLLWSPLGVGLNLGQSALPKFQSFHIIYLTLATSSRHSDLLHCRCRLHCDTCASYGQPKPCR